MHDNLSERAYGHIRQRLARGAWPPGARLANRPLAEELGISFTPVREAIQRLASEGLVDFVRGAGAFVRAPDRRELRELYELRLVLEPFAASLAARHATVHEFDELEVACAGFRTIADELSECESASTAQLDHWFDYEELFHTRLIDAARNRWLSKIGTDLRLVAQVFHPQRSAQGLVTRAVAEDTWETHAALVERLRQRDEREAANWMRMQIERGRDLVLAYFDGCGATSNKYDQGRQEVQ